MAYILLTVGYERELLRLRSLLLRRSLEVEVIEAFDFASALQIARGQQRLDLILLCHTVPVTHRRMLIESVRTRCGDVPVLLVFSGWGADGSLGMPVSNDPEQLLATIRHVLSLGDRSFARAEQWG